MVKQRSKLYDHAVWHCHSKAIIRCKEAYLRSLSDIVSTTNKVSSIFESFSVVDLLTVLQMPLLIIPSNSALKTYRFAYTSFIVGRKPHDSRINRLKKYLPIINNLMSVKLSDVILVNLAQRALKSVKFRWKFEKGCDPFRD